ncbi:amidase family protein [Paraburkholderia sp. ZP32-5]|uniref:amidase family protein n=1 Tax=Paraburkholderia sp. ZP32-5 TaxID=2883245 RepID=UPI001EEF4E27|nr:amidase family protein [Paraburkholderia sp. ZP32-5]
MTGTILQAIEQALDRARADEWNCLSDVLRDRALDQAAQLDRRIAAGFAVPPLAGLPYVVKSLFDVKGACTLAGGPADASLPVAADDAQLVRELTDAGAILIGIGQMDEYAYGFFGNSPHHGRVLNPIYRERVSGGSSSGSAAAVAAGIVPFAVGSDTNGSVRVPAAFCGIFSLKPSYGRLPLAGSMPLAQSLDHAGILADSLDTLASVWFALDPAGLPSVDRDTLRLGWAAGDYRDLSSAPVRAALVQIQSQWPGSAEVELLHVEESLATASRLTAFEAAANHRARLRDQPGLYSDAVARRLAAGARIRTADYELAKHAQNRIGRAVRQTFSADGIDVLIAPVAPVNGLGLDEPHVTLGGNEVTAADAAGLFTRPFSLTGLPVLTIPAARDDRGGPLTALQLIGRPGEERTLFACARELLRPVD